MPERTVSDYLSEWKGVSFDDLLASLVNDMRGDLSNIINLAEYIRIMTEPGKPPVEGDRLQRLQMFIERILRSTASLSTILEAVNEYSDQHGANRSG